MCKHIQDFDSSWGFDSGEVFPVLPAEFDGILNVPMRTSPKIVLFSIPMSKEEHDIIHGFLRKVVK